MKDDDNIMRELSLDDLEAVNGGAPYVPHWLPYVTRPKSGESINPVADGSETEGEKRVHPLVRLKDG